ncbi:MAG: NUDIX domain-containing protein [Myxococcales bacterium]|nr:NUDIX domain-containing protein [Myxococcales bacterium]MCB9754651.1 NUDIX domain-containing protein [Myxococcales bacterium]
MASHSSSNATHPEPPKRRLLVVAGLIWLDAERLIVQRRAHDAQHGAGHLELPGGKIELGEAPASALARELNEEWGPGACAIAIGSIAEVLHHVYPAPGAEVVLLVYHCDARALLGTSDQRAAHACSRLHPEQGASVHVFARGRVPVHEFLAADRPCVEAVRRGALTAPW